MVRRLGTLVLLILVGCGGGDAKGPEPAPLDPEGGVLELELADGAREIGVTNVERIVLAPVEGRRAAEGEPAVPAGPDADWIRFRDGRLEPAVILGLGEDAVATAGGAVPRGEVAELLFGPALETEPWIASPLAGADEPGPHSVLGRTGRPLRGRVIGFDRPFLENGKTAQRSERPEPGGPLRDAARRRAEKLRAELEGKVSSEVRSAAASGGGDPGDAHAELAAALVLGGDPTGAAWAGLSALRHRWTGRELTSAAVLLLPLQEWEAAELLLLAAYDTGYRDLQIYEAFAVLYDARGDTQRARQHALLALRLAPDDPVANANASAIALGSPPQAPADPDDEDDEKEDLDDIVDELVRRRDRALGIARWRAAEMRRLRYETEGAFEPSVMLLSAGAMLRQVEEAARQARMTREQYSDLVLDQGAEDDGGEAAYRTFREQNRNLALNFAGRAALGYADGILDDGTQHGMDILFWAEVLSMSPAVFAAELRTERHGADADEARSVDSAHYVFGVVRGPSVAFWRGWDGADAVRTRALQASMAQFGRDGDIAANQRRQLAYEAEWCSSVRGAFADFRSTAEPRTERAARRFDRVSAWWIEEAAGEVDDVRLFTARVVEAFQKKLTAAEGFDVGAVAASQVSGLDETYARLVANHLATGGREVYGTADFLREQQELLEAERAKLEVYLAQTAENIETRCAPVDAWLLARALAEEWEGRRRYLLSMLQANIVTDFAVKPYCEATLGPFKLRLDESEGFKMVGLKLDDLLQVVERGERMRLDRRMWTSKGKGGKASVSVGATPRAGELPDVSVGVRGKGSYGPFRGKTNVTLFLGDDNPHTGQRDGGVEISATAGLGLRGKKGRAGCYPGDWKSRVYARGLARDAAPYFRHMATRPD